MIQPFILKKEMMFGGALDFSFLLDAPAGKHGFAEVRDGHFFVGGKRIRFYGFNIAFKNLFSPKGDAEIISERLSKAGVNFARIHAPDCIPRDGESLLLDYSDGTSLKFDPEQWDKLDYFMYCLKQKGIYLQLDLLVRRGFMPGDDLDYPDDLFKFQKQCHIYNRRLIELQKEYANHYLTHVNPYTGLRYIDDPAVVLVQVMNENSIFWDEGTRDDIGLPSYRKELNRRFNQYLLAKYGSRKALDAAWTKDDGSKGLLGEEDPEMGTVRSLKHLEGTQMYVDWRADYKGMDSPARYADYTEFLTKIQLDFAREMRDHLLALGVRCPINISNHAQGAADIYSIDRYTDVNQDNAYWNHPDPTRTGGPYYNNLNMVDNDPRKTVVDNPFKLNLVTRLNHDRVAGKPFIAAEWNILYGTDFRSDALPMVAAYASLQDWDGMVLYAYHHVNSMEKYDDSKLEGPFNLYNDPATWGMVGLCSCIFQKGLIKEACNHLEVGYSERDLYAVPRNWIAPYGYASFVSHIAARFIDQKYRGGADAVLSCGNTPNGDYTEAKHGLIFSRSPYADGAQKYKGLETFLQLHRKAGEKFEALEDGNIVDQDYRNYSYILDKALKKWGLLSQNQGLIGDGKLVSDTEEMSFDFGNGIFKVNAPEIKIASGNTQGKALLGNYEFDVTNNRMTLALLALDGLDTDRSKHLLLIALGWCGNLDVKFEPQADGTRIMRDAGHGPVSIESLEGALKTQERVTVYPLNPDGSRKRPLEGDTSFAFKGEGTMYFELVKDVDLLQ